MNFERDLRCFVFAETALELACRLRDAFAGTSRSQARITIVAPPRLAASDPELTPFAKDYLAEAFNRGDPLVFIGAAGIATRLLAPLIRHKSRDSPVVVIDPAGRFVISLLSGHWGGANELAENLALLLGATPVITDASDSGTAPALDLILRDAGLKIVDWPELPRLQGAVLRGETIAAFDPLGALPPKPFLIKSALEKADLGVHWRELPRKKGFLRASAPALCLGVGFRKNLSSEKLRDGLRDALKIFAVEPLALNALATVNEKSRDLADAFPELKILAFAAADLAGTPTPNPSKTCGKRFGQPPFSVCESAALLGAGPGATLVYPKISVAKSMTFALAVAPLKNE